MPMGKPIPGGERTLILKVLKFFEDEKKHGILIPIDLALKRTSAATGVSIATLTRIKQEEKVILEELKQASSCSSEAGPSTVPSVVQLRTPGLHRRGGSSSNDESVSQAAQNFIFDYYTRHNKKPSLAKIFDFAKKDLNFSASKETLRKILKKKLGYSSDLPSVKLKPGKQKQKSPPKTKTSIKDNNISLKAEPEHLQKIMIEIEGVYRGEREIKSEIEDDEYLDHGLNIEKNISLEIKEERNVLDASTIKTEPVNMIEPGALKLEPEP